MARILKLGEVKEKTGLSRSSIYLQMAEGSFPGSINIGKRSIGWLEQDIEEWIAKRVASSIKSRKTGANKAKTQHTRVNM